MLRRYDLAFLAIGLVLIAWGGYLGLFVAPPEKFMGEVYRVIYVHVPAAWMSLLAYTISFGFCIAYLVGNGSAKNDARAVAAVEVGVLFNLLLLISGSIWGKPTWGVWWTWDPRLTSAAVMFFTYAGYLALRHFVDIPEKRATYANASGILAGISVPIVWYSVKWWNTLHQVQSTPQTVDSDMVIPLRINAFGFLALMIFFMIQRYRLELSRQKVEASEPPELKEATSAQQEEGAA